MDVKESILNGHLVLAVEGRLDANSSAAFQERLLTEVEKRPNSRVVVDLTGLNYLSSAGLRVLLVAAKTSKKIGTEVRLAGLRPHVEEVFSISGFDALFQIFPNPEAAAS
ncbi:STAS domain-containing protein [bacterium]|nr:STAS domain-containing protein [bacterium]